MIKLQPQFGERAVLLGGYAICVAPNHVAGEGCGAVFVVDHALR